MYMYIMVFEICIAKMNAYPLPQHTCLREYSSTKAQTNKQEFPMLGPAKGQIWRNIGPGVKIRRRTT